jgi:hypothetical protein
MLKRSSIVKGQITPEMIAEAAEYLAGAFDTTKGACEEVAEAIASMWFEEDRPSSSAFDTRSESEKPID